MKFLVQQKKLARAVDLTDTTFRRWRRDPALRMPFIKDQKSNEIFYEEEATLKFIREKRPGNVWLFTKAFERIRKKGY